MKLPQMKLSELKLSRRALTAFMLLASVSPAACQSVSPRTPAVLVSADEETLARLRALLAEAMGTARVDLGPEDLTQSSVISVHPPRLGPLEGRCPAVPTQFDLMLDGGQCFAVRRGDGDAHALPEIACRPL
jgi:hypothetical protein